MILGASGLENEFVAFQRSIQGPPQTFKMSGLLDEINSVKAISNRYDTRFVESMHGFDCFPWIFSDETAAAWIRDFDAAKPTMAISSRINSSNLNNGAHDQIAEKWAEDYLSSVPVLKSEAANDIFSKNS